MSLSDSAASILSFYASISSTSSECPFNNYSSASLAAFYALSIFYIRADS